VTDFSCQIINNDVDKIMEFLNRTGSRAINFAKQAAGVTSSGNIESSEDALRSSTNILADVRNNLSKLNSLRAEALELGCNTSYVDTGIRYATSIINETEAIIPRAQQAIADAKARAAATAEATKKQNNAGTGTPGTAGQGSGATDKDLEEVAVTGKKKPDAVVNDPAAKGTPDGTSVVESAKPKIVGEEPVINDTVNVDVQEPQINTNDGLTGDIEDAQEQATVQDAQNYALEGDWRVRLSLAPASPSILYRAKDPGVLAPLAATDGVIFPYTPTVNITYSANYEPLTITHANYKTFQYQSSSVDQINIQCDFTAQDTEEANYLLAVIHFFRAATKMFYGQTQSPKPGTPPPLCYLYGLGQLQFNAHPLVIANFTYNLPNDVDYIRATNSPTSSPGENRSASNDKNNSQTLSDQRLNSGNQSIAPGGTPQPAKLPQTAAGGTVEPTYVPTKIQLQIVAYPITTRYDQSRIFNNNQYNTGQLMLGSQRGTGGFW
jgi:hypothetical protein